MSDCERILLKALEKIARHPYYQEPSGDNPKYHSAVCRLNDCIETAMNAIQEVTDIKCGNDA